MAIVSRHSCAAALALALLAAGCKRGRARPIAEETSSSCVRCHGLADAAAEPDRIGLARSAPPRSTRGTVETSDRGVGAHRQHLVDGTIRRAIECRECHVVPTQVEGHIDGSTGAQAVTFGGALGRARLPAGVEPRYDPEAAGGPSCSNVYCHGATLGGGTHTSPVWTAVDGTQTTCGSCHGYPPPNHAGFTSSTDCNMCHSRTVLADNLTIDVAGGLHINGRSEGPTGGSGCSGCHGYPPNDALHATHSSPPSTEGAYGELHTGAGSTAESYDFGCGECHPLDSGKHNDTGALGDGVYDIELTPPATPVAGDEVKRRNGAAAAYDDATGKWIVRSKAERNRVPGI